MRPRESERLYAYLLRSSPFHPMGEGRSLVLVTWTRLCSYRYRSEPTRASLGPDSGPVNSNYWTGGARLMSASCGSTWEGKHVEGVEGPQIGGAMGAAVRGQHSHRPPLLRWLIRPSFQ